MIMESRLAAADRRKKSNLIPRMQRSAPRDKFLVPGSHERSAKARKFGMARAIMREKRFNRRAVRQLNGVFRVSDNFLEAPKKKHLHACGLRGEVHKRIVTRGRVPGHSLRG